MPLANLEMMRPASQRHTALLQQTPGKSDAIDQAHLIEFLASNVNSLAQRVIELERQQGTASAPYLCTSTSPGASRPPSQPASRTHSRPQSPRHDSASGGHCEERQDAMQISQAAPHPQQQLDRQGRPPFKNLVSDDLPYLPPVTPEHSRQAALARRQLAWGPYEGTMSDAEAARAIATAVIGNLPPPHLMSAEQQQVCPRRMVDALSHRERLSQAQQAAHKRAAEDALRHQREVQDAADAAIIAEAQARMAQRKLTIRVRRPTQQPTVSLERQVAALTGDDDYLRGGSEQVLDDESRSVDDEQEVNAAVDKKIARHKGIATANYY
jgi:hypothetical protein